MVVVVVGVEAVWVAGLLTLGELTLLAPAVRDLQAYTLRYQHAQLCQPLLR